MKAKILFILLMPCFFVGNAHAQTTKRTTQTTTKKTTTKKTTTKKTTTPTKPVDKKKQLQNEKAAAERARKQSVQQAAQLNKSIKSNLDSVLILDNQIGRHNTAIDSLSKEISGLTTLIDSLQIDIDKTKKDIDIRKKKYANALRRMHKTRSVQQKLMFVFSAENFSQLIRRMRYMKEYSTFQMAQAQILRDKQTELQKKQAELLESKTKVQSSKTSIQQKRTSLQTLKTSCQTKVEFLNRNLATVQKQIQEYQKKEQSLNAEIDRIIQQEILAAQRAEAERKHKAEEARRAQAEAQRRAQAEAKRKAEAEAREKAKRLAEAKAAQERAKVAQTRAEAARRKAKTEAERKAAQAAADKAKAEAAAAKAQADRAQADARAAEKAVKTQTERTKVEAWKSNDDDTRISGGFTANKGRLPMPVTGSYAVVGHYGTYTVAGLRNVTLDNKGIDIKGQPGCSARAVYDGEVSSIFKYGSGYVVMLRHGSYISVYSGLSSVSVRKGQKVKTRDTLGAIATNSDGNHILQFQLRKENQRLNPEAWVR